MRDLTTGKISKNMFLFTLPLLFSTLLSRLHTTIDQIMVGQFLGEINLAAIGSTSSFNNFISSLMWSVDMGLVMYISTIINKEKGKERTVNVIKSYFLTVFLLSAIIVAVVLALQPLIFSTLNVGADIYAPAKSYFIITFIGKIMVSVKTCINAVFNFFGKSAHALKISAVDCVGKIVLSYLLMVVFPLGVVGVAISSVASMGISLLVSALSLRKELKNFYPNKTRLKYNLREMLSSFRLTLPCVLQQGSMYACGAIIQPVVNTLGTSSIAAYSICNSIYNICTILL